jgi:anion-transporting  ArsA/GET3 family ATPase
MATTALLKTISKVAGAEIVQDAVAFFQAFEGMEEGFRTRAGAVRELLADPATAFVLVTSARPDAIAEASFFAEKLGERDVKPAALVVNRIQPSFGPADSHQDDSGQDDSGPAASDPAAGPMAALEANLATLNALARREQHSYAGLAAQVAPAPIGRIPLFGHDVHELIALQQTADQLFA